MILPAVILGLSLLLPTPGFGASASLGPALVGSAPNQRRALILGFSGDGTSHPEQARKNFLKLVGNPENDPAKGWTCDFSWDLMARLGLDPTNTPPEALFSYIGRHQLGYRLAISCGVHDSASGYWGSAVDNGIMPFAPQGNNEPHVRFEEPTGLRSAVGVAGGSSDNGTSYGPGVEFIDALPRGFFGGNNEDYAQSWANQVVAARFAKILDAHPEYNIWDARQHLRQAASYWRQGWTERNGFGRVNDNARIGALQPGPPVDVSVTRLRDRHHVLFSWRNFRQSDFAATVILREDGRVLYEGSGTNFVWTSDVEGQQRFLIRSRNRAGQTSRPDPYQVRTVAGLECGPYHTCLMLGAPATEESLNTAVAYAFEQLAINWVCDIIFRPGNAFYDKAASFPVGAVVGVLPDIPAMVSYAITNHYRLLIAPVTYSEGDLYRFKGEWDRATAAGILVVLPHHASASQSRKPQARRLSPPRLFSAITVGVGVTRNERSFGPGLECFDDPTVSGLPLVSVTPMGATARVASKLAQILDANPRYNLWDARQHLRQSSSLYGSGWVEDGGYGRPPEQPVVLRQLDLAPPLEIQAQRSADGSAVEFFWQNFMQTDFAETVIQDAEGKVIYHDIGNHYVWHPERVGGRTFKFFSRDRSGRLSRSESYTVVEINSEDGKGAKKTGE